LIGFFAVVGFSAVAVKKIPTDKNEVDVDAEGEDDDDSPSTPKRKSKSNKNEVVGTVMTPAGRRSTRLMAKKEA
jgi:hypothetical protein